MNPSINQLILSAIGNKQFSGCVLLVGRGTEILFHEAYGLANVYTKHHVSIETVFDLASLTKPLATTLAVIRLVAGSRLSLDQGVGCILADFDGTDKKNITIRQLLAHQSGYPAYRPYYKQLSDASFRESTKQIRKWLVEEPLICTPGEDTCYSDLGFMVLDWVLEEITGLRLDGYVTRNIYDPLGITDLFFNDLTKDKADRRYAATEKCPWRGRVISGEVHDQNAYIRGGVAGHAGLFGTAGGVRRILTTLTQELNDSRPSGFFPASLLNEFFRKTSKGGRPLGFDAPGGQPSAAGRFFSLRAVGHLGFTGTSFWMDPVDGFMVILLTNRIHPSIQAEGINDFRADIHDEIMKHVYEKR